MIEKSELLIKIEEVNDANKKAFEGIGLPNLVYSYSEEDGMVLEEAFSYGPTGRNRKVNKITPEKFYNIFFKD